MNTLKHIFQDWLSDRRARRHAADVLNLRARLAALEAEFADRRLIASAPFYYHEETSRIAGRIAALRVRLGKDMV